MPSTTASASFDLTSNVIVDTDISKHLVISVDAMNNPFSTLLLPLAYQHFGVLQALLDLALCRSEKGRKHSKYGAMPLALELKLSAIHSLSELLQRGQGSGLSGEEEEVAMAMALLLILHDVRPSTTRSEMQDLTVTRSLSRVSQHMEHISTV